MPLGKMMFALTMHGEVMGPFDSIKDAAAFAEEIGLVRVDIRPMTTPEAEREAIANFVQSTCVE